MKLDYTNPGIFLIIGLFLLVKILACDRISQPREYSETELEAMELKQPEFKQLSLFDVA